MHFDWTPSIRRAALVLCLGAGSLGCADFHRGPAPQDGGQDVRSDATALVADFAFETSVYPLLQIICQDCHRMGREAEYSGLVLTGNARADRAMVVALVVPRDPAASLLLRRATGEAHTGRNVISQDSTEYDTIASWIMGLPLPR
jgi:hypothetical protein